MEEGGASAVGISYKQKLEQMKLKRQGGGAKVEAKVDPTPPQQPPVTVSPVTVAEPLEKVTPPPPPQPVATVSPVTIQEPVERAALPPPQQPVATVSPVTIQEPVERAAPPPPQQPVATVSPVTIATESTTPTSIATTIASDVEAPGAEDGDAPPRPDFSLPVKDVNAIVHRVH